jgi:3-dehydroquinate dehydratase II
MPGRVLVLNGPNLNLLGQREPEVYGRTTLVEIETVCRAEGKRLGVEVECRQSNSEAELIGWVQAAQGGFDAVILNAGAYSHTSIALLDAFTFAQQTLD